jgi:hypothetical protein
MNTKNKTEIIKLIYKDYKKWLRVIMAYGILKEDAQDIFSSMIEKTYKKINEGVDISYDNSYNYWYIFKVLKGTYIDFLRTKRKTLRIQRDKKGDYFLIHNEKTLANFRKNLIASKYIDLISLSKKAGQILTDLEKTNNNLYKIKRHIKIYNDIDKQDISIQDYANQNKLSYYKCYNSYTKTKNLLKEKLCELEIN